MPNLAAITLKETVEITPVGFNLYIRKDKDKFGLYDYSLNIDILPAIYDRIEPYPNTTYLMIYKDNLIGVYDVLLRTWLVPVKFSEVFLSRAKMEFVVYSGAQRGLCNGVTGRVIWS